VEVRKLVNERRKTRWNKNDSKSNDQVSSSW
jgi:hypothetical protein